MSRSVQEDGMHGRVINLLSNDFSKFDIALCFIHDVWKGPFETILLGFLIWREIGISGVVGILFILSFIPIQSFIGKKAAHYRSQTTKRTDVRVRLMNEIINGIQVIKMYSWQENFSKVIEKVRRKEVAAVKGSSYILALLYCLWAVSRVSLFLTLITYVYTGNVLSARKVFIVTAFYNILNQSMVHFWPLSITFCAEGYISSKRLREFLLQSETKKPFFSLKSKVNVNDNQPSIIENNHDKNINIDSDTAIILKDLTAIWTNVCDENNNGLKNINYTFKHGQTYAVIGTVGSGKSSLLQAILGELQKDKGSIEIGGTLSYANQEAFLFEGTVRSNILFTEEYEEKRYLQVVAACGLSKDFEQLENGDLTVVGEKGVSLSGGQKARINLARAVYKNVDIYLLDDPLSAVDSDVGSTIFNECILKFLKNKTVILNTHLLQYLHKIENIIVMSNGEIKATGNYEELKDQEIANLMPLENKEEKDEIEKDKDAQNLKKNVKSPDTELEEYEEKESQEVGKVQWKVYKEYVKSVKNIPLVIFVLFLRVVNQSIASFIDYFVAQWVNWEESIASNATHQNGTTNETIVESNEGSIDDERQRFITIYMIVICTFIVIIFKAEFSFFYSLLR